MAGPAQQADGGTPAARDSLLSRDTSAYKYEACHSHGHGEAARARHGFPSSRWFQPVRLSNSSPTCDELDQRTRGRKAAWILPAVRRVTLLLCYSGSGPCLKRAFCRILEPGTHTDWASRRCGRAS